MKAKERNSNIELLRIIAMFMILGLHVNMLALGLPEQIDLKESPISSFTRIFFEQLCIIGVNIFVLISGWFGINFKTKGLYNFLFQSLFFSIVLFIPFAISGSIDVNKINILSAFLLYKNAYWFVWAYLILYILSPALNSFVEYADKKIYKKVLVLFFIVQTIVFVFTSCGFFYNGGYDPLFFIGLYLLMRYIRKHCIEFNKFYLLLTWGICTCINILLYYTGNSTLTTISLAYVNPLNIISATAIVLLFTKISLKSNAVNYISASCFAVYLAHMHFCIIDYYKSVAITTFNNYGGVIYIIRILLFITIVFATSVLIDKVRISAFNKLWGLIEKRKNVTR